jgi:hypothetical protein
MESRTENRELLWLNKNNKASGKTMGLCTKVNGSPLLTNRSLSQRLTELKDREVP